MTSSRSRAQAPKAQFNGTVYPTYPMRKARLPTAREDGKLRPGGVSNWVPFPFRQSRVGQPREKRARLFRFFTPVVTLLLTTVFFCLPSSEPTAHHTFNSSPIQISLQPKLKTHLRRPPPISRLQPRMHTEGPKRIVPGNHLIPFVYTAIGLTARDVHTNASDVLLFLYTQGTIACSGELATPCSHLDVTSCVVGADFFPVMYDANGVFTCLITRRLRNGERLTVIVSKSVWKKKVNTDEDFVLEEHLKVMKRFGDGSYILPSDTVWEDQIDPPLAEDEGRYRVCLMTQEKLFADYVPEWLTYHRRIGIDYVYIYDNNSPKSLAANYKDAKDVEVVHWPWERSQIQAQNHFLLIGRRRCQWGVLIDVDEFVMMRPGLDEAGTELPLKAMLRELREQKDISQIRMKSIVLGSSGHVYHPRSPVAESYWHLASLQDNLTKPIVWLGHVMPDSHVHRVSTSAGYYTGLSENYLETHGELSSIGLCHLKYRSWEDYVEKGKGGRNSFQVSIWDYSSKWSIHSPSMNHLSVANTNTFTGFRRIWRRTLGRPILPPELGSWSEADWRYDRIKRKGWVWKKRRALLTTENTTLSMALIERERSFQRLKDWEIAKKNRLAQWNKKVDFVT